MKTFIFLTAILIGSHSFANTDPITRLEKAIELSAAKYAQEQNFATDGEALYYRIHHKDAQFIAVIVIVSAPPIEGTLEPRELRCEGTFALPAMNELSFGCEALL